MALNERGYGKCPFFRINNFNLQLQPFLNGFDCAGQEQWRHWERDLCYHSENVTIQKDQK